MLVLLGIFFVSYLLFGATGAVIISLIAILGYGALWVSNETAEFDRNHK